MSSGNDWDVEETDALTGLEHQLEIVRRRQADETPIDLLSAAREQAAAQQPLDPITEQRIWRRIQQSALSSQPAKGTSGWTRWAGAVAAIAATVTIAVIMNRETPPPSSPPAAPIQTAAPRPRAVVTFTKPEVKLSPTVLTWRGKESENSYVRDLRPAIDAYRAGNYADAEKYFATLVQRYPRAIEAPFYLGVVRMLKDDFAGAVEPLTAAAALDVPTFADDAAWFLAVAEQRSGGDAVRKFEAMCAAGGTHAKDACDARQLIATPR
jgi:TolA-binding protein